MAERKAEGKAKQKEAEARQREAENSFENVAREWWKWWLIGKSPRHADTTMRRMEADVFPAYGYKSINEVTAADVRQLMIAEAGEVGAGHEEEAHGGGVGLVGQNGGEGDAAVVVDGDVQVLVAGAPELAGAVSVMWWPGLRMRAKRFDIEMDKIARPLMLVAHDGRRRVERTEPVHAVAAQDAAEGGAAEVRTVRAFWSRR